MIEYIFIYLSFLENSFKWLNYKPWSSSAICRSSKQNQAWNNGSRYWNVGCGRAFTRIGISLLEKWWWKEVIIGIGAFIAKSLMYYYGGILLRKSYPNSSASLIWPTLPKHYVIQGNITVSSSSSGCGKSYSNKSFVNLKKSLKGR